jgi:hypothetical protein
VSVTGREGAGPLLSSLNPSALLRQAADFLHEEGHTHIRFTDGPGDGGRDIHSVDAFGEKHLT